MTSPKVNNLTETDTEQSEEEESPQKDLKSTIIKMINQMKEDMYEKLNEFKENANNGTQSKYN